MIRRHPRPNRADPSIPSATLFRADFAEAGKALIVAFHGIIGVDQQLDEVGRDFGGVGGGRLLRRLRQFDRRFPCAGERPNIDEARAGAAKGLRRSEEHTSELQSLMRISYAVFCLKKKTRTTNNT